MRKGGVDYDLIKQIIEAILVSGEGKVVIIDSGGNLVSDIPLSTLIRTRIYEQNFEDGTTDTTAYGGATQEVQSDEVYSGSYALKVTIPAGTTAGIETPKVAVSPQQLITFSFVHKEDSNIDSVKLIISWYRSGGGLIYTEEKGLTLTTDWDIVELTAIAPSRSAYMTIKMEATAGSSDGVVYIDDITMDIKGQILRVDKGGWLKVATKDEGDTIIICKDADISGGVTVALKNFKRWTLYLKVADAIDITIELSPDGGNTWFIVPESPISFSAAGDDIVEMGYDATHIRLTGSNTNAVTAIIRGVF